MSRGSRIALFELCHLIVATDSPRQDRGWFRKMWESPNGPPKATAMMPRTCKLVT